MIGLCTSLFFSRGLPAKARLTCSYWGRLERFRGWKFWDVLFWILAFWDVLLLNSSFFERFWKLWKVLISLEGGAAPEVRSSRVQRCPEQDRVRPGSFHSHMILFIIITITIIILIIVIIVNSKDYLLFCLLVPLGHLDDVFVNISILKWPSESIILKDEKSYFLQLMMTKSGQTLLLISIVFPLIFGRAPNAVRSSNS